MAVPLSYSLRNIRVRWRLTLLAVVGITLVVAVFTVLMAMSEGFRAALRGSGRVDNAIVVTRGSASEMLSEVEPEDRNVILADSRLTRRLVRVDGAVRTRLLSVAGRLLLSGRGHDRVLRVARTIADLDGRERVKASDVDEALGYRVSGWDELAA